MSEESINEITLLGRLSRDPEMRYTPSGQAVTSFCVVTNRWQPPRDEGGEGRELPEFTDCVAWNNGKRTLAERVAQYTSKGSRVLVKGRLQTRSWEGQDGKKRYKTEVVAFQVVFLASSSGSSGSGGGGGSAAAPADDPGGVVRDVDPDDIPF
ncbi:MAG TPA: single-stranded DNA-binding protein [Myxococcaceae bacterium]|jgi:single-strand DNA-binding protein|nr:single-stranded DNA-binding protein [Myxococcaceae bacterium]